jgi:FkbM family methyltransferase
MKSIATRLGFAALRAGIAAPKLRALTRYREHWAFKCLLERLRITLLLDVGANDGSWAESVRLMGYKGRIASFEPNPSDCESVRARASGDPNWTVECCALGSAEGTLPLNVIGNSVFSSLLTPTRTPPVSEVVPVPVHRLDAVWDRVVNSGDRVFLKTDTQGYDLHVLRGAGEKLAEIFGVQTELNVVKLYENSPHYLSVLEFLESNGFSILELRPLHYTREHFIIEFDCFAARASAAATK